MDDALTVPEKPRRSLEGLDWFTEQQAARYCCVSVSKFRQCYAEYGIEARNFMGKKLFERRELFNAIHGAPDWYPRGGLRPPR